MIKNRKNIALITGAGSGIGKELAIQVSKMNYHVLLLGRAVKPLEKVHDSIKSDNLLNEFVSDKLQLISTTTREKSSFMGRMTHWLLNGKFESITGTDLSINTDRVMICGSLEMLQEHKEICLQKGMMEGSNSAPGHFVIEKAFVD